MSNFLLGTLNFLLTVIFLGIGGILLLAGRKYLWVLLGGGSLLILATVLAEVQGYPDAWSLVEERLWISLLLSLGAGAVGVYISQRFEKLAVDIIGFAVGVFVATWFDEILLVLNGQTEGEFTWWVGLIFIGAGILGVWITRQDPDQALILISVIIGARTIESGLKLDGTKSITAVIILGLGLTGVVVQYATLLRERPRLGQQLPPVPHPVSEELPYE